MRGVHVIATVCAFGGIVAAVYWSTTSAPSPIEGVEHNGDRAAADGTGPGRTRRDATPSTETPEQRAVGRREPPTAPDENADDGATVQTAHAWPTAAASAQAVSTDATGTPTVPTKIAFRALWYLGVDPEAERTWSRAINDPAHPPGVRSDLIADMIDEGYTDNSNPGQADLPLILARLEIIERYAPNAMDDVNRTAFQEVYRDLLELYARITSRG